MSKKLRKLLDIIKNPLGHISDLPLEEQVQVLSKENKLMAMLLQEALDQLEQIEFNANTTRKALVNDWNNVELPE